MNAVMKPVQLPIVYEEAVKSLEACITLDEAKYFSDKADALAAWAKIYRNDVAGRKARQLKLHAFRRMGVLAKELRPWRGGCNPGSVSLLKEQGFKSGTANQIARIGSAPKDKFEKALAQPKPPSTSQFAISLVAGSDSWKVILGGGSSPLMSMRSWARKHTAKQLARGLTRDETEKARELVTECAEWLDEFLQHLPKPKRK